MENLFGNAIPFMSRVLDFVWQRQEVISNNLTNAETPNYKAQYVTFEDALRRQMEKAGVHEKGDYAKAITQLKSQIHEIKGHGERLDGNTVDSTDEMVELTRATYQYQYLLNAVNQDITGFRTVLRSN